MDTTTSIVAVPAEVTPESGEKLSEANDFTPDLFEALEAFVLFADYVRDFGRLSGGQMHDKYGDDGMEGYNNILRRLGKPEKAARAALAKARGQ